MPRYLPHQVNIALGTLSRSASSAITIDHTNSPEVNALLAKHERAFERSEGLNRLREVIIHEDQIEQTSSLRFLPVGASHAPFYMVSVELGQDQRSETDKRAERLLGCRPQVLQESLVSSIEETGSTRIFTRKQAQANAPVHHKTLPVTLKFADRVKFRKLVQDQAGALCLTIRLTNDSFPRQPFADTRTLLDVKIDVYCNGEYAGCSFVPARAKQASNQDELVQRFHGRKVDRVGERPWVLSQATLIGPDSSDNETDTAKTRWDEISQLISTEARQVAQSSRAGQNKLGDYLRALAKVDIPQQVIDQHCSRTQRYGVIDVVATLGRGKKYSPSNGYLHDPTNMIISELQSHSKRLKRKGSSIRVQNGLTRLPVSGKGPASRSAVPVQRGLRSSATAIQETDTESCEFNSGRIDYERSAMASSVERSQKRRRTGDTPGREGTPGTSFSTPFSIHGAAPTPQTMNTEVSSVRRSRRSQLHSDRSAYDSKRLLTTEEVFQDIGLGEVDTNRRKSRDATANEEGIAAAPLTHAHSSPARADSSIQEVQQSEDSPLSFTNTPSVSEMSSLAPPAVLPEVPVPTPTKPRRKGESREASDWKPGQTHENSVLSYDGDKLRQVKSSRSGWFEESSIMFGVRYVIF